MMYDFDLHYFKNFYSKLIPENSEVGRRLLESSYISKNEHEPQDDHFR